MSMRHDRPRPPRDIGQNPERQPSARHAAPETQSRHFVLAGRDLPARPQPPGLYVVATPIGNLGDISLRALETLAGVDLIACEDTRITHRLLAHHGIETPMTPYHEHNAATARPLLLARLGEGRSIALVSDAGTPLISDPGYKLVVAVREAGHAVTAIPGASATLTALASAGLPTDRFFFEGFLPPKQVARQKRIAALARIPGTLIFYESGGRLADTLADLAAGLGPREVAICRELTKLHEEVRRATLADLAQHYAAAETPKGEIVILVAPPGDDAVMPDESDIDALLREALAKNSVKDAAADVAGLTGLPRRDIYQRALTLQKTQGTN